MPMPDLTQPHDSLRNHLQVAWKKRCVYLNSHKIAAFRLVSHEELGMEINVDVYGSEVVGSGNEAKLTGGECVLHILNNEVGEDTIEELRALLQELFGLRGFYVKYRLANGVKKAQKDEEPVEMVIEENNHKFLVNLNNYLDTGLFLDHRETRKRLEQMIAGNAAEGEIMEGKSHIEVLNLFAYTGAFSVYAAAGGAYKTHTVDVSGTYCDWARRNFELNEMPEDKHWIYKMETFEFLKYAEKKGLTFDYMVIDPPTFSHSKKGDFSVQRDHVKLLSAAGELLKDGGTIIFSNNFLEFKMDDKVEQFFNVRNIQSETVPQDFWLNTTHGDWWTQKKQIHNCFLLTKR